MLPVTVIIPVFNAFAQALDCLQSVGACSASDTKVVVIDDASTEGRFEEILPSSLRSDSRLSFVRNEKNLGFVESCNQGIRNFRTLHGDVVLLNSDTLVTARWLEKLQRAAMSRPNIGTVTPLTNNGSICSFPRWLADNKIPRPWTLKDFAEVIEKVARPTYPELPSAVGFCMYITSQAIEKVGLLDEQAFGKGYGEENDFCCRSRLFGFVDILDDATYVFHHGSCSFSDSKRALIKKNEEVLRARHPQFFPAVSEFYRQRPLQKVHERILTELLRQASQRGQQSILHILHNGPFQEHWHPLGGTELHVQDLITSVPEAFHWTLVPTPHGLVLSACLDDFEHAISLPLDWSALQKIITPEYFDIVHLHHARGYNRTELVSALRQHGNYLVSMHDYQLLCPRVFMLTPKLVNCTGRECSSSCKYPDGQIARERQEAKELLHGAKQVIGFSSSTQRIVHSLIEGDISWEVLPHGIKAVSALRQPVDDLPSPENPLRVAFVGHLPDHKGGRLVKEVVETSKIDSLRGVEIKIAWHIVGQLYDRLSSSVKDHGKYPRGKLGSVLDTFKPHVVVLPSICHETYSVTVDEVWNAGYPVIVNPVGAPADRVRDSGAGWLTEAGTARALVEVLRTIVSDPAKFQAVLGNISRTSIWSLQDEAAAYVKLYKKTSKENKAHPEKLLSDLGEIAFMAPRNSKVGIRALLLAKTFEHIERMGLRTVVKDLAHKVLPPRFIEELKRIKASK